MPEDKSPADLEREVEDRRAELAEHIDELVDTYAPGKVVGRRVDGVKAEALRIKTLVTTGREVYVDADGVEHVREIQRGRIAAAAGGAALLVVVVVVLRRRRRRSSAWQKLVDGAQDRAEIARSRAKDAANEARKSGDEARRLASAR